MNLKHLFIARARGAIHPWAAARLTPERPSTKSACLACVIDKWDEKEPDKGHKLVDYAGRCVNIPDDPAAAPKSTEDCVGKYEYMPDGSWKGTGTCTNTFKGGDTMYRNLGGGFAPQGILVQDHRRHRQIPRRQWRRHVHVREPDGHPHRRQIQRQDRTALTRGKEKPVRSGGEADRLMDAGGASEGTKCVARVTQPRRGERFPLALRRSRARPRPPYA